MRPLAAALACTAVAVAVGLGTGCAHVEAARLYADGTRALDRGDPATAVVRLERAAALLPAASEVQNHLGIAYLESGREAEALGAFQRAVRLDCSNRAARENLGVLEARLGTRPGADGGSDGAR